MKSIIVYRNGITPSAKKSLDTTNYSFELFSLGELQLNVTHHRLVPKHERVSQSIKNILDTKYKGQLPFCLSTDPIVRYYAFKKGEYIKITRKDGSIAYRVVK
jgi:DNA-directed RNA polymerases I, II, and III subunit RPABC1